MLIISDVHTGFKRTAGVTPASAEALRTYLYSSFRELLHASLEKHLLIDGDLFDGFEVDTRDWLEVYSILTKDWLERDKSLTLVAGNHDISRKGDRVSSFQALCEVLQSSFDGRVQVIGIDRWDEVWDHKGVYAVAHCSNQDVFDLKVREVLAEVKKGDYVLFHANYHNGFAACSDHSLNVSEEVAREFIDRGAYVVFSHEHQARREMPQGAKQTGAEVIVLGNQWPTSIADCLGNQFKFAHVLKNGELTKVKTWSANEGHGLMQPNWRELAEIDSAFSGFFRVVGEAKAHEAADALNAIAKFRQKSEAFVVTNAIEVEGMVKTEELAVTMEQAKAFDVMGFIKEQLEPSEFERVEWLLEKTKC